MNKGIDYGMGQTNIDTETGIRFGVIPVNDVLQAWSDSSEADYGKPHCPVCGNECSEVPDDFEGEQYHDVGCADHYCDTCKHTLDSSDVYGDEPLAWYVNDDEYTAHQSGDDRDIFITKSPYYTRAAFCSPCAPGACYLPNPCEDGEKAYCFGQDWFDNDIQSVYGPCPYPIWEVATDKLIYTPPAE